MKILHSADIHLGELIGPVVSGENARMLDTMRCFDFMTEQSYDERPDIIVIAGDLFNKSRLWADEMLREINVVTRRLRVLANIAPTILLFGTRTHDNMEAFRNIENQKINNLYVVTEPGIFTVYTKAGQIQVAGLPGYDKADFRTMYPAMAPEEENQRCSELLGEIVTGLSEKVDPAFPSLLVAHYAVGGAVMDNGTVVSDSSRDEVVLAKHVLQYSEFSMVLLGHLHRAQKVVGCGRPTFYSGSLAGVTFNEEGQDKGFWLHELTSRLPGDASRFIKTPSREYLTLEFEDHQTRDIVERGTNAFLLDYLGNSNGPDVDEKIVRVHYTCDDEISKQFNRKELERGLYASGAFYVKEILPKQVAVPLARQTMNEAADPLVNLEHWLKEESFDDEEVTALVELARPLIASVSAKMPTGKISGVFKPEYLEVRSYRSFKTETLDFSRISFATVNGANGVGKSALFMDALSDCLFEEETREGDITGWISNGIGVKSGSITFAFSMGETMWRVIRTRSKAGKVTLALQEMVQGQWVDRSEDRKDDTQAKIVNLLGMDAKTFRCCALIMQDAYGLFMEADKSERMEVFGNILGLNIYELLSDLLKNPRYGVIPELNRALEKVNSRMADLRVKVEELPALRESLADAEAEIVLKDAEIQTTEASLKTLEEEARVLQQKNEKLAEMRKQIDALTENKRKKEADKNAYQEKVFVLRDFVDTEGQILAGVAEHDQVNQQVIALTARLPRLGQIKDDIKRERASLTATVDSLTATQYKIEVTEATLSRKDEFEKAVAGYVRATKEQAEMDTDQGRHQDLQVKAIEAQNAWTSADKAAESRTAEVGTELDGLRSKVAMLGDSGCIDAEKANCKFLADAQTAKARIPVLEGEWRVMVGRSNENVAKLHMAYLQLKSEVDALSYDAEKHKNVKAKVVALLPKTQEAAQLSGKVELLQTLKALAAQLEDLRDQSTARIAELQKELDVLNNEIAPLNEFIAKLEGLETWVPRKERLSSAKESLRLYAEASQRTDEEIVIMEAQIQDVQAEKLIVQTYVDDYLAYKGAVEPQIRTLAGKLKALRGEQNILYAKVGGLKTRIEDLQKDEAELQRLAVEAKPIAARLTRHQVLARAFGFDGVPFSIVRATVPELSVMANQILGQMTGGKMSLEMKTERVLKSNTKKEVNALEVWINDYQRGSLPYKSRSGGQRVKAALSVAFALADLKASRAGIQLGMMFVDEPPFLDEEGTEAYCDALALLREKYEGMDMKVIGISHDPRMKARFPQQIEVVDMGDEGSKVRMLGVA